jgi:hypothetical protein
MIQDPIAITILLGSFALLILMRTPIAFALGVSSIFTALYSGLDLMIIAQRMVNGMESIPLIAIPFFILAGQIMSEGRIAEGWHLASLFRKIWGLAMTTRGQYVFRRHLRLGGRRCLLSGLRHDPGHGAERVYEKFCDRANRHHRGPGRPHPAEP